MRLYHFTDVKLDNIDVKHFGNNIYTLRDVKASGVKRAFYYLEAKPLEYRFETNKYMYIVEIKDSQLYDLRKDKKRLVKKFGQYGACDIEALLKYIKKQYRGVIYNTGGSDNIACLFYNIRPIKKITRR